MAANTPYQKIAPPPLRVPVVGHSGIQDSYSIKSSGSMDDTQPLILNQGGQYKLYPQRWLMLLMVVLTTMSNVMMWVSFSPIEDLAGKYYDVSSTVMDLLSTTFLINFVLLSFPTSWLINKKGLRYSLVIGAFLNMLGGVIRAVGDFMEDSESRFGILFLGQFIAAAAQPVILSCPTVLAAQWFGENERAIANMIGSVSNPVGVAVGTVVSSQIVTLAVSQYTYTAARDQIRMLLWVNAGPCILAFILVLLFFRERPPTAPSLSSVQESEGFLTGLGSVIRNKQYLLLLLSFGIGVGSTSSVSTLSGQIVGGQGFSAIQAGYFFAILLAAGIMGAVISGKIVDRTKKFTETLRVSFGMATLAFLMFTLVLPTGIFWLVCISTGMMGFFCFAALPVALELSVECTYPVSESTSAGLMWLVGQLFGIIITFSMDGLKGDQPPSVTTFDNVTNLTSTTHPYPDMTNSCWFVTSMAGLAAVLLLFFRTEYHRLSVDLSGCPSPLPSD
jgi:FLVCR family MFS transporter 7